jgi:hypothetical protein
MKSQIPVAEIHFASKSGFLSKSVWLDHFATGSTGWKNKVWKSFLKRGYFLKHPARRADDVLVPNPKDGAVKRLVGDAVASSPYIFQLDHDEQCSRIALTLQRRGIAQAFMTEAEQKRHFFGLNKSFSEARAVKFPDLLLEVKCQSGIRRLAIEVELSRKSPARYRKIFQSYAAKRDYDIIVFLSRSPTIFDALARAMRDTTFPTWERQVGFSSIDGWLKDPALTPIHLDSGATTLAQLAAA